MLRLRTLGGLFVEANGIRQAELDNHPRLLALLAFLASGGARGVSRASVTRVFWPESVDGTDRAALNTALYRLRQTLAADLVLGKDVLRLNRDLITSDLAEFNAHIARHDLDLAVRLYEGEFLEGVYLGAPGDFDDWADQQRTQLAREYRHALTALATAATESGDCDAAVDWLRRLARLDPHDEDVAERLERALAEAARSVGMRHARRDPEPLDRPPVEPLAGGSHTGAWSAIRHRLTVWARNPTLVATFAVITAVSYGAIRNSQPSIRIQEPGRHDTVDVHATITVISKNHSDLWLWIKAGTQCWLQGPFERNGGDKYSHLAQFGEDNTKQSGLIYTFVVLAQPELVPSQRVVVRQLEDCQIRSLRPDGYSDSVAVVRR